MATPNIRVTLSDFTDSISGAGHFVQLSPSATHFGTTNGSSQITFSSVTPGTYVLNMPGSGVGSLKIEVPDESGTLDAVDLAVDSYTRSAPAAAAGSPEGVWSASPGATYWDTENEVFYVKKTGTGNTGWQELIA